MSFRYSEEFRARKVCNKMVSYLALCFLFVLFFNILSIYFRERERASTGGGAEGEGQADSTLSMEPEAALNLRTPRS